MSTIAVILARAGSKGLSDKCVRDLLGRPVLAYTFDHALAATRVDAVVFTSDSAPAKELARVAGIAVVDRPAELATDTATVDAAVRHAVEAWEGSTGNRAGIIILLYGNIPVRPAGLIDGAIEHLQATGADSVRSVAPVTKQHPDWIHCLSGDRMTQFRPNTIHRRQDLEPFYYHDGAVIAVTREALFAASPTDAQSFLGHDRRAVIVSPEDTVDIDGPIDLHLAEAILRAQLQSPNHQIAQSTNSQSTIENRQSTIHVGGRPLGPDHPIFVIAEAGVNHNGSVETALQMVDAAAKAGADAVKFQMFSAKDLTSSDAPTAPYQSASTGRRSQREMLCELELGDEHFARIKRHCDNRGILFLATPFGPAEIDKLASLGAPAIKIASTDLTNLPLIDHALETGLPLILSTGASTADEIQSTVRHIVDRGGKGRLILLHCISCYPAPLDALNLRAITTLGATFGATVGISDHSTAIHVGAWAVTAGACVLEKHFTLDRRSPGPDHAMSLEPEELAEYIRFARAAREAGGDGRLGMHASEAPVRRAARRSVTAAVDIPAGEVLASKHLALKRPGTGLSPAELPRLLGRRAQRAIPRDTLLSWDHLA